MALNNYFRIKPNILDLKCNLKQLFIHETIYHIQKRTSIHEVYIISNFPTSITSKHDIGVPSSARVNKSFLCRIQDIGRGDAGKPAG